MCCGGTVPISVAGRAGQRGGPRGIEPEPERDAFGADVDHQPAPGLAVRYRGAGGARGKHPGDQLRCIEPRDGGHRGGHVLRLAQGREAHRRKRQLRGVAIGQDLAVGREGGEVAQGFGRVG